MIDTIQHTDLLSLCASLEPGSIDMILCDLPYGVTDCKWDSVIPLERMWPAFRRVIKPKGAIVLTATQPFTSTLGASNIRQLRYSWVWTTNTGSNFLNAKRQPMKEHQDILVFGVESPVYYPVRIPRNEAGKSRAKYGHNTVRKYYPEGAFREYRDGMTRPPSTEDRVPSSVLYYVRETGLHPTQKPVGLFEYLIKTYTQPGEIVFDPCVGSGTTAVAAIRTGRRYICGDTELKYVEAARERVSQPIARPLIEEAL